MTTFNIPYELCLKLDLLNNVSKEHKRLIKNNFQLEDVKIKSKALNGWMTHIKFIFSILNRKYTYKTNYNTSSPYALYICELNDYNYMSSEDDL